ncbi:MAG: hypothetical protein R3Y58_03950 [Eubacteriales bacterium]
MNEELIRFDLHVVYDTNTFLEMFSLGEYMSRKNWEARLKRSCHLAPIVLVPLLFIIIIYNSVLMESFVEYVFIIFIFCYYLFIHINCVGTYYFKKNFIQEYRNKRFDVPRLYKANSNLNYSAQLFHIANVQLPNTRNDIQIMEEDIVIKNASNNYIHVSYGKLSTFDSYTVTQLNIYLYNTRYKDRYILPIRTESIPLEQRAAFFLLLNQQGLKEVNYMCMKNS